MAPVSTLAPIDDTLDPITGQPKVKPVAPTTGATPVATPSATTAPSAGGFKMLDPNAPNQLLSYTGPTAAQQAKAATPAVTMNAGEAAGRQNVIGALQTKAIEGTQSPIQGLVQNQTAEYMKSQGFGGEQYKQQQLADYDRQRAMAFKAAKEQVAPLTNTGVVQESLLQNVLQGAAERQNRASALDLQNYEQQKRDAISKLEQGRATAGQESEILGRTIGNLATATGATEGDVARAAGSAEAAAGRVQDVLMKGLDVAGQTALTNLQSSLNTDQWVRESDWKATQANIDREIAKAEAAGDRNLARELQTMKDATELKVLEKQQAFQKDLAVFNADNQKELSKMQQDFDRGMMYDKDKLETIRQKTADDLALTMQGKDINAQMEALNAKARIDTQLKQMEIDQSNYAAKRDYGWATADKIADQDFTKLMTQIKFDQEMAVEKEKQKFQNEYAQLQAQLDEAKSQNDFNKQQLLNEQKARLDETAAQNAKGRTLELEANRQNWELKKMTEGQNFEQAQMLLKNQLDTAMANGDVDRQKLVIGYQSTARLAEMAKGADYDKELASINNEAQKLRDQGNYKHAEAMQKAANEFQLTRDAEERAMEKLGITAGFIKEMGTSDDVKAFVEGQLGQGGKITIKNAVTAAKEAAKAQYDSLKYMWAQSQPETMFNPTTQELTPAGEAAFAEYSNKAYKDPVTKDTTEKITDSVATMYGAGDSKANPEQAKAYDTALKKAVPFKPESLLNVNKKDEVIFNNPPQTGSAINVGGKLYVVSSGVGAGNTGVKTPISIKTPSGRVVTHNAQTSQWVAVTDPATGQVKKLLADGRVV